MAGHLQAMVLLKTFGDTRVDLQLNEQARRATELHNEKVKKNREILKRLIDCVMFLGKQELSFRGHNFFSHFILLILNSLYINKIKW